VSKQKYSSSFVSYFVDGPIDLWEWRDRKMIKVETKEGSKYYCSLFIRCSCGKEFYVVIVSGSGFIYCPYCGELTNECVI